MRCRRGRSSDKWVYLLLFQIEDLLAVLDGIFCLRVGAFAYVAANIDNINCIGHVNFTLMYVVQHLLGAWCLHFIIAGMAEQPYADDNISLKG